MPALVALVMESAMLMWMEISEKLDKLDTCNAW
jgi:hypothetical protein